VIRLKLIIGIVAAVLIILGVFFLYTFIRNLGGGYQFKASPETVIKEIKSLNRLETAQFTIEKVIDAGTTGGRIENLLFGDRILLIAHGSVIAGFDLAKVQERDIAVDGDTLRITLPAPQILVSRLDPSQTRVYDRQTGLLSKGDKDLESEARTEAEKIVTDAACRGGILDEAAKNGRNQLTALLKGLNFSTVIFTIPQGSC
jgi:hypothetical protein